jgi:hypothetical protein
VTTPARQELPIGFALGLGGYFIGLLLLQQLAFILAPVPVAVNVVVQQTSRAKVYILIAVLAGIMGTVIGARNPIVPCVLYSVMGFPLGWAILNRIEYKPLLKRLIAFVLVTQVVLTALQWEQVETEMLYVLEQYQAQLDGPEAKSLTDQQEQNLNMIIWLRENWRKVYFGSSFAGILMGVCLSIGWTYRAIRKRGVVEPIGSFTEFKPHDAIIWFAIGTALMLFANDYSPSPFLHTLSLNAVVGLFALYTLNGLSILLYGLNELKPNPILAILILMTMFMFGGIMMLGIVGLFDTWGEFRKRIDVRVQSVKDSENHYE